MKNLTTLVIALFAFFTAAKAQQIIAVQTLTDVSFFTDLPSAIDSAASGSTIYLPGGNFSYSPTVGKKLHFIGVGHHPDSTMATGITVIGGDFKINSGMTGGSLIGIYFTGNVIVEKDGGGNSGLPADQVLLKRCNLPRLWYTSNLTNAPKFWSVEENYFRDSTQNSIDGWFQNSTFSNNVIHGKLWAVHQGCSFVNNVFLRKTGNFFLNGMNGVSFTTNIFYNENINAQLDDPTSGAPKNFTFFKNIFRDDIEFPIYTHTGDSNFVDITTEILVDISNTFVYDNNYHISSNIGFAFDSDGNEILGIYNIEKMWKEGSLPSNPHIRIKAIEPVTDATGKLKVKIEVVSQKN